MSCFCFFKRYSSKEKKKSYVDISFTCMFSELRLDWLFVDFYSRVYLSVKRKSLLGEVGLLYGDPRSISVLLFGMLMHFVWKDRVSKV